MKQHKLLLVNNSLKCLLWISRSVHCAVMDYKSNCLIKIEALQVHSIHVKLWNTTWKQGTQAPWKTTCARTALQAVITAAHLGSSYCFFQSRVVFCLMLSHLPSHYLVICLIIAVLLKADHTNEQEWYISLSMGRSHMHVHGEYTQKIVGSIYNISKK